MGDKKGFVKPSMEGLVKQLLNTPPRPLNKKSTNKLRPKKGREAVEQPGIEPGQAS